MAIVRSRATATEQFARVHHVHHRVAFGRATSSLFGLHGAVPDVGVEATCHTGSSVENAGLGLGYQNGHDPERSPGAGLPGTLYARPA